MGNSFFIEKAEISSMEQPPTDSETVVADQPPADSKTVVAGQPPMVSETAKACNCLCVLMMLLTQCWFSCYCFHSNCKKYPRATHGCLLCGFFAGLYDANNLENFSKCNTYVKAKNTDEMELEKSEVEIFCPPTICDYLCMYYNITHDDEKSVNNDNLCCCECISHIIMTSGCSPLFIPCSTLNCVCNIVYLILCCDISNPDINVFGKFYFC
jgi:hypothetical protein